MNSFEKEYLKLINEESGIKILYLPSEIKKFNFKSFPPFEYKNVSIFQSAMHKDVEHVLNQLNKRMKNKYSLNDVFIIVKRGIDKFLLLNKSEKFNSKQSFNIISKTYHDIKIACAIERNTIKDELIFLNKKDDNILYHNDYFCFIYTVLESSMIKHNIDENLFVETIENDNVNIIVE